MSTLLQNIRFSIRTTRRAPGFASLVVLTLALGIAANVAIFAVVNAVLLQPLTFAEPDRLVMLWESNAERGWQGGPCRASERPGLARPSLGVR